MRTTRLPARALQRASLTFGILAFAGVAAACGGSKSTSPTLVATSVVIMGGNNQQTTPNTALADPLTVEVTDQNSAALPSQTVVWAITSGSGALSATTDTTNSGGQASVTFTPDSTTGTVTITAAVGSLTPASFTVNVVPAS